MGARTLIANSALVQAVESADSEHRAVLHENISALTVRVRAEYVEMPGLRLTVLQAARLFGVHPEVAHIVLDHLRSNSVLRCSNRGAYSLSS
jgi:hypothetical protein